MPLLLLWMIVWPHKRPAPLEELAAARARWASYDIDSYQMSVRYFGGGYTIGIVYSLQVDDGVVTAADTRAMFLPETQTTPIPDPMNYSLANAPANPDFLPTRLDGLTIESMFTFAEAALADETWPGPFECNFGAHHEAKYDAQYGYITEMHYANCSTGLLCSSLPHCDSNVTVLEFEPLPE
ncbi:MAG: hypothetical protein H7175_22030 [Burkholderiales bacterium]|nr:hypothetical protein [Anaerolineae bacterium]